AGLIVPLFGSEGALGALVLQRRRPGEFPSAVVSLMQNFADQSAIALENARLFEEIAQKSRELEIASQHKSQFVANELILGCLNESGAFVGCNVLSGPGRDMLGRSLLIHRITQDRGDHVLEGGAMTQAKLIRFADRLAYGRVAIGRALIGP